MSATYHQRRANRLRTHLPTLVQSVGQGSMRLHENIEKVYQRVHAADDPEQKVYPCFVEDLSTNGAFLTGESLPLLSRVAFEFRLVDFGPVDVVGWVLWHRKADCKVPEQQGERLLNKGFGVLFEAISLDARIAIQRLVETQNQSS